MATKSYITPNFVYGNDERSLAKPLSYSMKIAAPMDARAVLSSWGDLVSIGQAAYVGMTFYIKEGTTAAAGKFYIISAIPNPDETGYNPSSWSFKTQKDAEDAGFAFLSIGEDTNTTYKFESNTTGLTITSTEVDGEVTVTIDHNIDSVYTVRGSKSVEGLTDVNLTKNKGDVYNVIDEDGFYIGASATDYAGTGSIIDKATYDTLAEGSKSVYKYYPPYTNVVWTADNGWDALGGTVVGITGGSASVEFDNKEVGLTGSISISIDSTGVPTLNCDSLSVDTTSISSSNEYVSWDIDGLVNISASVNISVDAEAIINTISTSAQDEDNGVQVSVGIANGSIEVNVSASPEIGAAKWIWLCQESTEPSTTVNIFAVEP